MSLRGRLVALAMTVSVLLAGTVLVLVRSRTADCTVSAPRPSLPPALRALGDFDQAYDSSDFPGIEDAAGRAAGALDGDLIGATPETPVAVSAADGTSPDALVVPLRSHAVSEQGTAAVAGLVVFLLDCQGGAYFANVEDDATLQPPLLAFPPVSRQRAATTLGVAAVRLVYATSPLHPTWVAATVPAQSLQAR